MGEDSTPVESAHDVSDANPEQAEDLRVRLPQRRHATPWTRRFVVVCVVGVILAAPLWVDPTTLDLLRGEWPTPPPPTVQPAVSAPVVTAAAGDAGRVWREIAADEFTVGVGDSLGIADPGGQWRVSLGQASVDQGAAVVLPLAAAVSTADLPSTVAHDTTVELTLTLPALPPDGVRVGAILRRTAAGTAYFAVLRVDETGALSVGVDVLDGGQRRSAGTPVAVSDLVALPGVPLRLRAEVTGTDPATVRIHVWPAAASEPDHWQLAVIDWTGALQLDGSVGFGWSILEAEHSTEPPFVHIDDFTAAAADTENAQ